MASHYLQIPGQAGNDVWIYGFCRATSDYERMARASGEEVCNTPLGECCLIGGNYYLCRSISLCCLMLHILKVFFASPLMKMW